MINSKNNQKGFSLLEIMVALVLVVTIITIIPTIGDDQEQKRTIESINKIKRAVRFSESESILRNVIVRIKFNLDANPTDYVIEYGNKANLVLPEKTDFSRLSNAEREAAEERAKEFDNKFRPVNEFGDESKNLPSGINIYGLGTTYYGSLIKEGEASIYFYPTGEKDSALVLLSSEVSLASLSIAPFEDNMVDEFFVFSEQERDNIDSVLENKAKEIFDTWIKE